MLTKWYLFAIGSVGLVLGTIGAGCGPTVDQTTSGTAGSGGSGGTSSSSSGSNSSSSSGSTGGGGGGTVACDPMNFPSEGTPCMPEGASCNSGCEDPCSFCNILSCTDGKWTHVEVFPAPCLSCEDVCGPVVAAQCAGGPPNQMACVQGCNQNQMGPCKIPFNQMLACVGSMPTVTCDAKTRPTVAGCEMQFEKLYACIMP